MLEKPRLDDKKVIACLHETYGISTAKIEFLPLGYDSYAAVYRVTASDEQTYFLKLKQDSVPETAVRIPRYLKDQGIQQVVAPLPTLTGSLWETIEDFTLLLYPFIEGVSGMRFGLSPRQWIEFGMVLRQIHATRLPTPLSEQLRKEDFIPNLHWSRIVKRLHSEVLTWEFTHPLQRRLVDFWKDRHHEIGRIIERAEALGRQLQTRSHEFVLCHADIHTANLLLSPDGSLHVVDWDQPIIAPRERDLMFIINNPIGASTESQQAWFLEGYGDYTVDPLTMAYYRYEWVVADMGGFGETVLLRDDLSEESYQQSLDGFLGLFAPGNSVDLAYGSERELSI